MKLCIVLEHHFFQSPDGRFWTVTQCPYEFFLPYLEVFESVRVIARVFPVPSIEADYRAVEGLGVEFFPMPAYKGPYQFLAQWGKVCQRARQAVQPGDAVIMRVPSQVANSIDSQLQRRGIPFAVEVVADPFDVYDPAASRHPVAPLARFYLTRRQQSQCKRAIGISYVTKSYLQQRYPGVTPSFSERKRSSSGDFFRSGQYITAASDANLRPECFRAEESPRKTGTDSLRLIFVGTLGSLYKGPDILIDAISICASRGVIFLLKFVGSGSQMGPLRERCRRLGIEHQITFAGDVQVGQAVRDELDASDVFVLPSRAEGLPRAMLEAMARRLPCIGSKIGGIPELLTNDDMVPPNDPGALAESLLSLNRNRARLYQMSACNFQTAQAYSASELAGYHHAFYQAVALLTAKSQTQLQPTAALA